MAKLDETRTKKTRDDYETPNDIFDPLNRHFNFNLDPASSGKNKLCKRHYTKKDNGLIKPWDDNAFVNPPYGGKGRWKDWVLKAIDELNIHKKYHYMFIIPSRTGTKIWQDVIFPKAKAITFMAGRVYFELNNKRVIFRDKDGKMREQTAQFPTSLVLFSNKAVSKKQLSAMQMFGYTI